MHTTLETLTRRVQSFVDAWREESRARKRLRKRRPVEREAPVQHADTKDQAAELGWVSVKSRDGAEADDAQTFSCEIVCRRCDESSVDAVEYADQRNCDIAGSQCVEADDKGQQQQQRQDAPELQGDEPPGPVESEMECEGAISSADPEALETGDAAPSSSADSGPSASLSSVSEVDATADVTEDTTPAPQTPVPTPRKDEENAAADPTPILTALSNSEQAPQPEPERQPTVSESAALPLPTPLDPSSSLQQHTRTQHEPRVSQMHGWLRSLAEKDEEPAFVADAWHEEDRVRG